MSEQVKVGKVNFVNKALHEIQLQIDEPKPTIQSMLLDGSICGYCPAAGMLTSAEGRTDTHLYCAKAFAASFLGFPNGIKAVLRHDGEWKNVQAYIRSKPEKFSCTR